MTQKNRTGTSSQRGLPQKRGMIQNRYLDGPGLALRSMMRISTTQRNVVTRRCHLKSDVRARLSFSMFRPGSSPLFLDPDLRSAHSARRYE